MSSIHIGILLFCLMLSITTHAQVNNQSEYYTLYDSSCGLAKGLSKHSGNITLKLNTDNTFLQYWSDNNDTVLIGTWEVVRDTLILTNGFTSSTGLFINTKQDKSNCKYIPDVYGNYAKNEYFLTIEHSDSIWILGEEKVPFTSIDKANRIKITSMAGAITTGWFYPTYDSCYRFEITNTFDPIPYLWNVKQVFYIKEKGKLTFIKAIRIEE